MAAEPAEVAGRFKASCQTRAGRATLRAMKAQLLRHLAPLSLAAASLAVGCKKEEPPPPLPSAQPVAATAAPLQLKPEDAGVAKPAEAGAPKKVGHGGGGGGLSACCAALSQNSTMAPEPTKTYMVQAAAMCQALAAQGKDKAAVGGMLLGALRGAGMPAACR